MKYVNWAWNTGADLLDKVYRVIPVTRMATKRLPVDLQEVVIIQDALQNDIPLNMRRGVIEAHNSYAYKGNVPLPNQELSINEQLGTGLPTVIELDIHLDAAGNVKLCHGNSGELCLESALSFEDALKQVASHAEQHPDRVFMVNLEDRSIPGNSTRQSVYEDVSKLLGKTFGSRLWNAGDTKERCSPSVYGGMECISYPTAREMIQSGCNIAVVSQIRRGNGGVYKGEKRQDISFSQREIFSGYTPWGGIDSEKCEIGEESIKEVRVNEEYHALGLGRKHFGKGDIQTMERCGVKVLALDKMGTAREEFSELAWGFDEGQMPQSGYLYVDSQNQLMSSPTSTGAKPATCQEVRVYCDNKGEGTDCITVPVKETDWLVTETPVSWSDADAQCKEEFGVNTRFATPTNGYQMHHLTQKLKGKEAWVSLNLEKNDGRVCLYLNEGKPPLCVETGTYTPLPISLWSQVTELGYIGGSAFNNGVVVGAITHLMSDSLIKVGVAKDKADVFAHYMWGVATSLKSTSALVSWGASAVVTMGLEKSGITTKENARFAGDVAGILVNVAQKATYWGAAEVLLSVATGAVGLYIGKEGAKIALSDGLSPASWAERVKTPLLVETASSIQ